MNNRRIHKLGSLFATVFVLCGVSLALPVLGEEGDTLIVPGSRIGVVKLNMMPDQVQTSLGNHDKEYSLPSDIKVEVSEWKEPKETSSIKVFYDHSGHVVQIASAAPVPATKSGISTKSTLADVNAAYKHLIHSKFRCNDDVVDYYDDVTQGIAFEFTRPATAESSVGKLYAIIVHSKGKHLIPDLEQSPLPIADK